MEKPKKELKENNLVQRLVPDPGKPKEATVMVTGYLGKSSQQGYWRLYLSAGMNEYIEISEDDIVETQSLESKENPTGGTTVWLRNGAQTIYTFTGNFKAQADFLGGDITSSMLYSAPLHGISGYLGVNAVPTIVLGVTITLFNCNTYNVLCTMKDICPLFSEHTNVCPSKLLCTKTVPT
jgi:hypothetical protein